MPETSLIPYHERTERPERVGEIHLSKQRRDFMAEAKCQGQLTTDKGYREAAKILGVTVEQVREWDKDDSVNVRAMQKFQPRAFQSLVKHWPKLESCMDEGKSWAFKLAAQISTVLPVGGVSFQQNVAIDARASGHGDTHTQFARNFWNRVRQSRGGQVIDVTLDPNEPPIDPPDEEPEPEGEPQS